MQLANFSREQHNDHQPRKEVLIKREIVQLGKAFVICYRTTAAKASFLSVSLDCKHCTSVVTGDKNRYKFIAQKIFVTFKLSVTDWQNFRVMGHEFCEKFLANKFWQLYKSGLN